MHLNPYGEYAIELAVSLANDWPPDRAGIVARTREYGMSMPFPEHDNDQARCRDVLDEWPSVVDASSADDRARLLNEHMATAAAYPRLTDHNNEGWHLHYRDVDDDLPLGPSCDLQRRNGPASDHAWHGKARQVRRPSVYARSSPTRPATGPSATAHRAVPPVTQCAGTEPEDPPEQAILRALFGMCSEAARPARGG